jgi:hypothetical protein
MWKFAGADVEFHDLANAPSSPVHLESLEPKVGPTSTGKTPANAT